MGVDQGRDELLVVFDAMSGAWAAGDAAVFADFYSDGATVIGPGSTCRAGSTSRRAWTAPSAGR